MCVLGDQAALSCKCSILGSHVIDIVQMVAGAIEVFQGWGGMGEVLPMALREPQLCCVPPPFPPFSQSIFSNSRDVDPALVQKAIMAMLRLCQRLLPYKTDISEPLMKGEQYNGQAVTVGGLYSGQAVQRDIQSCLLMD